MELYTNDVADNGPPQSTPGNATLLPPSQGRRKGRGGRDLPRRRDVALSKRPERPHFYLDVGDPAEPEPGGIAAPQNAVQPDVAPAPRPGKHR